MVYITVKQSPMYHQMTLEEFLFKTFENDKLISKNTGNTRTYEFERISDRFMSRIDVNELVGYLAHFNGSTAQLREKNRQDLYSTFYIPKKSGGLRRIDAPKPELMDALRRLKTIFEEHFHVLYHTAAFAYVPGRSTIDAVKRHQKNESKWFGKYDLSNFFGSTTLDFVMQQFSMIFPFSEIVKYELGKNELERALELAFLNGGLPQGTPISPLITNVMMIPIDYKVANKFRDFERQSYVYTRYADDFIVSSKYGFNVRTVERVMIETLAEFNAPFTINEAKTRYGSSAGRNWNLGLMLNKDNEITVGKRNKRQFMGMLHNYVMDRKKGIAWDKHDVQTMDGYYNYYRMVEKETIDRIVEYINKETNANVLQYIREDLR